jgi:lysophospholipase L1-like esterase
MVRRTLTVGWASLWAFPFWKALIASGWGNMIPSLGAGAILWILGWLCLRRALRRDPDGVLLGAFLQSPVGVVSLLLAGVLAQALVLVLSGTLAVLGGMALATALFALWSASGSSQVLGARVARAWLAAGSVVLALATVEGFLRWNARRLPPNDYEHVTWGFPVVNNRLGFREREFEIPKPAGTFRIMVLGDSLTWGAGLTEEHRYTRLLENRLRTECPHTEIEVLNFARPGAPTTAERDLLNEYIDTVQPDLVVIGFCVNDPQPKTESYAVELERYRRVFDAIEWLGRFGLRCTREFVHTKTDQFLRNRGLVPHWQDALDRVYDPASAEWRDFEKALADIAAMCRVRSLPPPVLVPLLQGSGDFNQPDESLANILRWCRQASDAARRQGLVVVNLEEAFKREGRQDRSVNPWDGHPSARCNEIYAEELAAGIAPILRNVASRPTRAPPRSSIPWPARRREHRRRTSTALAASWRNGWRRTSSSRSIATPPPPGNGSTARSADGTCRRST